MIDWLQPIDAYCERLGPEFWAEPFNALSNVFMLVAGLTGFSWWLQLRLKRERKPTSAPHGISYPLSLTWLALLSLAAVLTATGSFLFHTYANFLTLWGDILPILFFMEVFLAFTLREVFGWNWLGTVFSLALFLVVAVALQLLLPKDLLNGSVTYIHGVLVLGLMIRALNHRVQTRPGDEDALSLMKNYAAAFVIFLVSLFFRTFDQAWCEAWPHGTHFIWHILNGILLFQLIRIVSSRYRLLQNSSPAGCA